MEQNKKNTPPKNKEIKTKKRNTFFDKVTHLYLQEKHLIKIPKFPNAQDIQTMYLYNNDITSITNLNNVINLRNLYLQNNQIERIENISNLKKLKKLYLGKNKISVLEGLEYSEELEVLHVEKQRLVDNTPLCFDPRTIQALADSLAVLNIASNKIDSLKFLEPLNCLVILDASCNDLDDMKDVTQTVRKWFYLKELKLFGNPISKRHRYKEDIIANAHRLEILDNKNISDISRTFIKKFEEGKLIYGSKPKINLADVVPGLPTNYSATLQKAVSASIIKESKYKLLNDVAAFDNVEPIYLSWNLFPQRKALTKSSWCQLKGHKMENQKNIVVTRSSLTQRKNL